MRKGEAHCVTRSELKYKRILLEIWIRKVVASYLWQSAFLTTACPVSSLPYENLGAFSSQVSNDHQSVHVVCVQINMHFAFNAERSFISFPRHMNRGGKFKSEKIRFFSASSYRKTSQEKFDLPCPHSNDFWGHFYCVCLKTHDKILWFSETHVQLLWK